MMPLLSRRGLVLPLAAALAACGNPLSRPYPEKQIFVLRVPREAPRDPIARPRLLLMRDVDAAPGVEARGLVTRLDESRQQTDFWNEFALPPARLVDEQLRRWLDASGAVSAVLDGGSRARSDVVLEPTLTALYADATDPRHPAAQVTLAVLLLDASRSPPRLVAQETISQRVALANTEPATVVAGMNTALASIFARIEMLLRTLRI